MNGAVLFAAGVISGILGAMGLGGGGVLILYLVFFEKANQFEAQGINLIFFIPCAVAALIVYSIKKQIKYKQILPIIFAGIAGTFIGIYLSGILGTKVTAKLFGGVLCIAGTKEIFAKKRTCAKKD